MLRAGFLAHRPFQGLRDDTTVRDIVVNLDAKSSATMHGLVVWKAAAVLALGVGGVLGAAHVLQPQDETEPVLAPANVVVGRPAAATETQAGMQPGSDVAKADPFAGVDVNDNSVLRHIAGIEEKSRTRPAPRRAAPAVETPRAAPARPAASTDARPAGQAVGAPIAQPVAQPIPAAPVVAAAALPVATTPSLDATRTAPPPTAAPSPEPSAARAATDAASRPAPPTVLAAARTEPAPTAPAVAPPVRVINRTVPAFPPEAIRAGVLAGRVVARLTIDAEGRVTGTELLSATPAGYFERESRRALSTWRYEPTGQATRADVELVFSRE